MNVYTLLVVLALITHPVLSQDGESPSHGRIRLGKRHFEVRHLIDSSSSPHEISPTTLSPVASPINYSSKSAKPTISPTSNPTSSPTNSPTSRYSLVGNGHCLDSSNKKYSWTSVALSNASDQDCMNWCDLVPSSQLVGVSIEDSDTSDARCYCNFKGGLIPINVLLDVIHYSPQLDQIKIFKGRGAVETFSSDSGVMCYKAV